MQRLILSNLLALLLVFVPGSATLAQQTPTSVPLLAPPGPVTHLATRFDVLDAPAQYDQVLMIIDFPSGAWTPSYTSAGTFYLTVLDGEIAMRVSAAPQHVETYPAGSTFTSDAGESIEVGNDSPTSARVIATAMLPKGAPLMTIDPSAAGSDADSDVLRPTTVYQSSTPVERPAGAFELVHLVLDLDPGVWTPRHIHGGPEQVIVTSGQMTLQRHGDVETFATGESWVNASGVVHAAGNDDTFFAQVVVAFLLPAGKPLTTVV